MVIKQKVTIPCISPLPVPRFATAKGRGHNCGILLFRPTVHVLLHAIGTKHLVPDDNITTEMTILSLAGLQYYVGPVLPHDIR